MRDVRLSVPIIWGISLVVKWELVTLLSGVQFSHTPPFLSSGSRLT